MGKPPVRVRTRNPISCVPEVRIGDRRALNGSAPIRPIHRKTRSDRGKGFGKARLVTMVGLLWHRIIHSVVREFWVQTVHLFPILIVSDENICF